MEFAVGRKKERPSGSNTIQVGVYQAKTHFPELMMRVETGEEVTITRHGKAVARLLPIDPVLKPDLQATINELKQFTVGVPLFTP